MNILYVYGTLRPGGEDTVRIPGKLYDLGWFPGLKLEWESEDTVVCERIEVDDWGAVDRYEGYNPDHSDTSLYIRRPYMDGYIYEYNQQFNPVKRVMSGDWLDYTKDEKGINGGRFKRTA